MALLGKLVQTSSERKEKTLDYSEWLADGETLSTLTSAVTPAGNNPVTVDITLDTPATSATMFIGGGDDAVQYKIIFTATTSSGQIKQDEVLLNVKDL